MLMIVAHHFVVNSGLYAEGAPMMTNPNDYNTLWLLLFGMWGKTGINCFLLITGYFMCKSKITWHKFIKLMLWIYLYKIVIYSIFLAVGYETLSPARLLQLLMPIWGLNSNFTSCFIAFWLTIPFWNTLINNISKQQHQLLLLLLLGLYTIFGSIPHFHVTFNYLTWFGVIYLISSYIRIYPSAVFERKNLWGWISVAAIILASISVLCMHHLQQGKEYFFVADSNKIFAVAVAVSTFLFYKNIQLQYHSWINAIGGSAFGVLLIHANSDAMRQWLWKDALDCVGHYSLPFSQLALFSVASVLSIFIICIIIDRIRVKLIEEPFFKWYDKKNFFAGQ